VAAEEAGVAAEEAGVAAVAGVATVAVHPGEEIRPSGKRNARNSAKCA
jgi:hypothetical protein